MKKYTVKTGMKTGILYYYRQAANPSKAAELARKMQSEGMSFRSLKLARIAMIHVACDASFMQAKLGEKQQLVDCWIVRNSDNRIIDCV